MDKGEKEAFDVDKNHWILDVLSDLEEFANESKLYKTEEYLSDMKVIFLNETRQQETAQKCQGQSERLHNVCSMNSFEKILPVVGRQDRTTVDGNRAMSKTDARFKALQTPQSSQS